MVPFPQVSDRTTFHPFVNGESEFRHELRRRIRYSDNRISLSRATVGMNPNSLSAFVEAEMQTADARRRLFGFFSKSRI